MIQSSRHPDTHILLGIKGEDAAAAFLERHGFKILARNWRHRRLELDIVCEIDGIIVFVEIKTRRGNNYGGGAAAITADKKRNLVVAANAWLARNGAHNRPCRFDVLCLTGAPDNFRVEHYQNAFDCSQIMGCGHSSGQYW